LIGFNGTFSINRLYSATEVWNVSRMAGGDNHTIHSETIL